MKLLAFTIALALAGPAAGQTAFTTGDFILQKKTSTGYAPVPITPVNGRVLSWSNGAPVNLDLAATYAAASHAHTWASLTAKPTTLAGYGITDAPTGSGTSTGTNTGDQTNITGNAATATLASGGANGFTVFHQGTPEPLIGNPNNRFFDTLGRAHKVVDIGNLNGVVTSVNLATSIANGAITSAMLANGAVANLSGTNSGDNAANTSGARAIEFMSGTFTAVAGGRYQTLGGGTFAVNDPTTSLVTGQSYEVWIGTGSAIQYNGSGTAFSPSRFSIRRVYNGSAWVVMDAVVTGTISASSFVGVGTGISGLNASNISTGTLALARGGTGSPDAGGARTNFGLGTADSPTFTGLTLAGGGKIQSTVTGIGSTLLYVSKLGTDTFQTASVDAAGFTTNGIFLASNKLFQWSSSTVWYGAVDLGLGRNAAGPLEVNNGAAGTLRDMKLRSVIQSPPASITPAANGELVFEATSNTSLTVKLKGTDGTVRSVVLTLAP